MELVSHLHGFLVGGMTLIKRNAVLVNGILEIMKSTLKISLKRKIYQPHFNVSIEGLFQLYEAVYMYDNAKSYPNVELGLKVILMSAPPITIVSMVSLSLSPTIDLSIFLSACVYLISGHKDFSIDLLS